jgi:hypothetical protein
VALYVFRREGSVTLSAVGQLVGVTDYPTAAQAIQRLSARVLRDKNLQRFMSTVINVSKCRHDSAARGTPLPVDGATGCRRAAR